MLASIQFLRGVAAYGVVMFHTMVFLSNHHTNSNLGQFAIGAAGVDLFFAISGFVMVYVAKPDDTPVQFMLRRIIRIVPLYWLCTLIAISVVLVEPTLCFCSGLSLSDIFFSFAFLPAYNDLGLVGPVLSPGWTLNYEMMFYALFAMTLLLPKHWRVPGLLAALTAVWVIASSVGFGAPGVFYGDAIVFEFALGSLIATAMMNKSVLRASSPALGAILVIAGLAALVLPAFIMTVPAPAVVDRFFGWGVPTAAILWGAVMIEKTSSVAPTFPLKSLGDSSYSAYLLHAFCVPIVGTVALAMLPHNFATSLIIIAAALATTMASAWISYRLIEQGASRWLSSKIFRTRPNWRSDSSSKNANQRLELPSTNDPS